MVQDFLRPLRTRGSLRVLVFRDRASEASLKEFSVVMRLCWDYIGILEKNVETTIMVL